jgi:hypothetical protein
MRNDSPISYLANSHYFITARISINLWKISRGQYAKSSCKNFDLIEGLFGNCGGFFLDQKLWGKFDFSK